MAAALTVYLERTWIRPERKLGKLAIALVLHTLSGPIVDLGREMVKITKLHIMDIIYEWPLVGQ